MKLLFRTRHFDTTRTEGAFCGRDLAEWLQARLPDWRSSVEEEDWGWAIYADKDGLSYIFGIYDHNTDDVKEAGAEWCVRIFNEKDYSHWFTKVFIKYVPPTAEPSVVNQLVEILSKDVKIRDIRIQPLD